MPTGLARAGDSLGDKGFGVTSSIHSGTPVHVRRPPTVGGLARSSATFLSRTLRQLAAGA